MLSDLLQRRFVMVVGKGGVGRTTIATLISRVAAAQGTRVLLCLSGMTTRQMDLFKNTPGPGKSCAAGDGIQVMAVDPVSAREEYGRMVLRNGLLSRIVFSNRHVRRFLDAVPGLAEWAVFGKVTFHVLQIGQSDSKFDIDMVVFDSPATGHGLDMIRLPAAIVRTLPGGRIREEAMERLSLLQNDMLTTVLPVTLPEEGPLTETLELLTDLERQGVPVHRIVINRYLPPLPLQDEMLASWDEPVPEWALPCVVYQSRRALQEEQLVRLQRHGGKLVCFPELLEESFRSEQLDATSRLFLSILR